MDLDYLYDQIDKDDSLSDQDKRDIYYCAIHSYNDMLYFQNR